MTDEGADAQGSGQALPPLPRVRPTVVERLRTAAVLTGGVRGDCTDCLLQDTSGVRGSVVSQLDDLRGDR